MSKRAFSVALVVVLVLLCAVTTTSAAAKKLTAADFKKMKMKELRAFLEDRGLSCSDCQEKSDFVKYAAKHADAPLTAGAASSAKANPVDPNKTLWEIWSEIAKSVCLEAAEKKGGAAASGKEKLCDAIALAADSFFMQHGKRTAQKLKKKHDALKKTSWLEPYQGAGRKMLGKLLTHCLKDENLKKCGSASNVQPLMEGKKVKGVDFTKYLTAVGIENTNPMYEILSAGKSPGGFKNKDEL